MGRGSTPPRAVDSRGASVLCRMRFKSKLGTDSARENFWLCQAVRGHVEADGVLTFRNAKASAGGPAGRLRR